MLEILTKKQKIYLKESEKEYKGEFKFRNKTSELQNVILNPLHSCGYYIIDFEKNPFIIEAQQTYKVSFTIYFFEQFEERKIEETVKVSNGNETWELIIEIYNTGYNLAEKENLKQSLSKISEVTEQDLLQDQSSDKSEIMLKSSEEENLKEFEQVKKELEILRKEKYKFDSNNYEGKLNKLKDYNQILTEQSEALESELKEALERELQLQKENEKLNVKICEWKPNLTQNDFSKYQLEIKSLSKRLQDRNKEMSDYQNENLNLKFLVEQKEKEFGNVQKNLDWMQRELEVKENCLQGMKMNFSKEIKCLKEKLEKVGRQSQTRLKDVKGYEKIIEMFKMRLEQKNGILLNCEKVLKSKIDNFFEFSFLKQKKFDKIQAKLVQIAKQFSKYQKELQHEKDKTQFYKQNIQKMKNKQMIRKIENLNLQKFNRLWLNCQYKQKSHEVSRNIEESKRINQINKLQTQIYNKDKQIIYLHNKLNKKQEPKGGVQESKIENKCEEKIIRKENLEIFKDLEELCEEVERFKIEKDMFLWKYEMKVEGEERLKREKKVLDSMLMSILQNREQIRIKLKNTKKENIEIRKRNKKVLLILKMFESKFLSVFDKVDQGQKIIEKRLNKQKIVIKRLKKISGNVRKFKKVFVMKKLEIKKYQKSKDVFCQRYQRVLKQLKNVCEFGDCKLKFLEEKFLEFFENLQKKFSFLLNNKNQEQLKTLNVKDFFNYQKSYLLKQLSQKKNQKIIHKLENKIDKLKIRLTKQIEITQNISDTLNPIKISLKQKNHVTKTHLNSLQLLYNYLLNYKNYQQQQLTKKVCEECKECKIYEKELNQQIQFVKTMKQDKLNKLQNKQNEQNLFNKEKRKLELMNNKNLQKVKQDYEQLCFRYENVCKNNVEKQNVILEIQNEIQKLKIDQDKKNRLVNVKNDLIKSLQQKLEKLKDQIVQKNQKIQEKKNREQQNENQSKLLQNQQNTIQQFKQQQEQLKERVSELEEIKINAQKKIEKLKKDLNLQKEKFKYSEQQILNLQKQKPKQNQKEIESKQQNIYQLEKHIERKDLLIKNMKKKITDFQFYQNSLQNQLQIINKENLKIKNRSKNISIVQQHKEEQLDLAKQLIQIIYQHLDNIEDKSFNQTSQKTLSKFQDTCQLLKIDTNQLSQFIDPENSTMERTKEKESFIINTLCEKESKKILEILLTKIDNLFNNK